MAYYIDTFSPTSYEAFSNSEKNVSGVTEARAHAAARLQVGDKLICYLTKLSRWVGILEVTGAIYRDNTPRFAEIDDPFVVRFPVRSLVWLPVEKGIPIREGDIWSTLSFTKNNPTSGSAWTGLFRSSLTKLNDIDGIFLENKLIQQQAEGKHYPVDIDEYKKLIRRRIRTAGESVEVSVPHDTKETEISLKDEVSVRQSIKMQALLAHIGEQMGFKIWLPRNDRSRVLTEWAPVGDALLENLPVNFDATTTRTIEQIDVLWIKRRSIVRAFEVEHTTSIYSGLLRMADLLALQPNIEIKLHLVAPEERRDKVFNEIQRPVFSLLESGPLASHCTYISYERLYELAQQKHLAVMSDRVIEEYEETALDLL